MSNKTKPKRRLGYKITVLAGLVLVGLGAWYLTHRPGPYDDFARCLADKGVKMYGAYWCPHCQEQKKMFGASFRYITYIECSLPGGKGQNNICRQAGIKGYPTWEFGDGSREAGRLDLSELSKRTGCSL